MFVELGGGTNPHPRADIVIDLRHPKGSPMQDASLRPWCIGNTTMHYAQNDSADEVYASHFIEHIAKGEPLIHVLNEAWRVLKPGGTFVMIMPIIGYTSPGEQPRPTLNWRPFADPTHVNYVWLPESFMYFTGQQGADADYGLSKWLPLEEWDEQQSMLVQAHDEALPSESYGQSFWSVRGGWEGYVRLEKP